MKSLLSKLIVIIIALLVIPQPANCQIVESANKTHDKLLNAALEIISNAGYCALITVDNDGIPRARTMDPFSPEDDFTIWFGTNPNSRKVEQISNNPNTTLYYFDNKTEGYVILTGKAFLINDIEQKKKHWKQKWESFYPDKAESYLLIKFVPHQMEILSPEHGIFNDEKTWQPPIIVFDR